jgi:hypothetical protein
VVTVGVVVATTLVVAVVAALALRERRPAGCGPVLRVAPALRVAAAAVTVLVAALAAAPAWRDGGAFAVLLVGVPLLCAGAALAAGRGRRGAVPVMGTAAVIMLVWSLLTGLGVGGWFLAPSALLLAAAVASTRRRPASLAGLASPPRRCQSPRRVAGSRRSRTSR